MNYKLSYLNPFGVIIEPKGQHAAIVDLDIDCLRQLFTQQQFVLLRGFEPFQNSNDFSEYCQCWGEVSIWPFGTVLELVEHDNPTDHIFDNNYVPLHWDGMYRRQIPEYQIFHCVKAPLPGQGGRTTFANTLLALKFAASEIKAMWHKVTGTYQRKMEFYHSKTVSPIVTKHPYKDVFVLRYNEPPSPITEPFLNPPDLEFIGLNTGELHLFHQSIQNALYSPTNFYAHEWQTGDMVIADNFSLLHGREKYVSKCARHLQRVHVLSDPPYDNPGLVSYQ